MELLKFESLEAARDKLMKHVGHRLVTEDVCTPEKALGKIISQDIYAPEDIPTFRRSTVDGYAVLSADIISASEVSPVFLTLTGCVEMGVFTPLSVKSGECVEVPTGAMLPNGADAVVMWEYTKPLDTGGITVNQNAAFGENIILPGEDMKKGDLLFRRGKRILPQDIGAMAGAGFESVPVYSFPSVSIFSTGDELVPPSTLPKPGQIRDINSYSLAALSEKHNLPVMRTQVFPDDEKIIEQAVSAAMEDSGIVIVSGGSSQGKKDMTRAVFDKLSSPGVFTHGIALKPGKPTILGYDEKKAVLLVGLPGHTVSALMVFELVIGRLLREVTGNAAPPAIPARLSCDVSSAPCKLTCFPCRLTGAEQEGYLQAEPIVKKSGLITALTQADGYFITPLGAKGVQAGEIVFVNLF